VQPFYFVKMEYREVRLKVDDQNTKDILIAILAEEGYEGFEERAGELISYIPLSGFNNERLDEILTPFSIRYSVEKVLKANWNKQWEENFQPVIVDDFCTVRADFHNLEIATEHEVVITPKMSFGTGHHATTQLMIRAMRNLTFEGKSVLDFGTGTGILAILSEKLGAKSVTAIDNEEWAYENSIENSLRNGATCIEVHLGSLEHVAGRSFDVILANINRHILLRYMQDLEKLIAENGYVLMSGLLVEDEDIVVPAARSYGLHLLSRESHNNWIVLLFQPDRSSMARKS